MKPKKKLLVVLSFAVSAVSFSQEIPAENLNDDQPNLRPIRIGAKIGFPNLIGGNVEYLTPLLRDKLSVSIDYSLVKSTWFIEGEDENGEVDGDNVNFNYLEGGLNYYFFKPGKGLYGGVSYGMMKLEGTSYWVSSGDYEDEKIGTGTIDYTNNSFNIKLGAKMGGLFYFRPEIGYAFTPLPNTIEMNVKYDDGSSETQSEQIFEEGSFLTKGFIANIGFGFSF
ncbi:hypothetical protein ACW6QP_04345 [Salegentibacter sp. HM20]